ncbi:hypothetical protein SH1V18_32660 [Vallitalea longa]|uniref:Uncharacterized protein n=1 Tax=Vallitalea longa TaxID=2936439 RepID=A0A9W5YDP9_9FIRM|nr:hypothetical protein [Vallitalea longa]GKX30786.1 hypothetical protein SH1V18_32660 [Vallitalea longa]
MRKKETLVVGILIIVLILLETFSKNTITDAMNDANIHVHQILHKVDCDKGTLVFYELEEHPNGCNIGLLEKSLNKYKWVNGAVVDDFSEEEDLTWCLSGIGKSNEIGNPDALQVAHGIVTNDNIVEVTVALKDEEAKSAEIVDTDLGRIWYFLMEKETNHRPDIAGLDSDGEIVYGIGL